MIQDEELILTIICKRLLDVRLSGEEEKLFGEWLAESDKNRAFYNRLCDQQTLNDKIALYTSIDKTAGRQKLQSMVEAPAVPAIVSIRRKKVYFAAASIVLLLGLGIGLLLVNQKQQVVTARKEQHVTDKALQITAPSKNAATLTLADGKVIVLDSSSGSSLGRQNVQLIRLDAGKLMYHSNIALSPEVPLQYNTISTPRGGQYQVVLPDGSRVWLNNASSIHFPTAFTQKDRIVNITGEAYFEVKTIYHPGTREKRPFIVNAGSTRIEVLGTSFNVNAYKDEGIMKTTLLEGSVKIIKGDKSSLLKPGWQAVSGSNGADWQLIEHADIDQALAWKNERFIFNDSIQRIMRQIARYYDVEVEFSSQVTNKSFVGNISAKEDLSEVLKMLELTQSIHFRMEGRKIIVLPGTGI